MGIAKRRKQPHIFRPNARFYRPPVKPLTQPIGAIVGPIVVDSVCAVARDAAAKNPIASVAVELACGVAKDRIRKPRKKKSVRKSVRKSEVIS